MKLAEELAAGPTVALGLIRKLCGTAQANTYEEQLDAERQAQQRDAGRAQRSSAEGVGAFLQKRKAEFRRGAERLQT